MPRLRRLLASTIPALSLTALTAAGFGVAPAAAATWAGAAPHRCVSGAALEQVQVGMTVARAQRLLQDRAVWWGADRDAWSLSYPKPCSDSRAMLIQASEGRVTYVVNEPERKARRCTTFAEFDRLRDGMPRAEAERLLHGKRFDLKRSAEWQPVPCQGWSTMRVTFRSGHVDTHLRGFYFG